VFRPHELVIHRGQARTRTSALQPAGMPAFHSYNDQFTRSRY
jgi:hypothetical protein